MVVSNKRETKGLHQCKALVKRAGSHQSPGQTQQQVTAPSTVPTEDVAFLREGWDLLPAVTSCFRAV